MKFSSMYGCHNIIHRHNRNEHSIDHLMIIDEKLRQTAHTIDYDGVRQKTDQPTLYTTSCREVFLRVFI
jgi:hypothetical protein